MSNRKMAVTKLRAGPVGRVIPFDLEKTDDGLTCVVRWRPDEPELIATPRQAVAEGADHLQARPRRGAGRRRQDDDPAGRACPKLRPSTGKPSEQEFFRLYPGDTHKAKKDAFLRCAKDAVERGVMYSINVGPDLAQTIFWTP